MLLRDTSLPMVDSGWAENYPIPTCPHVELLCKAILQKDLPSVTLFLINFLGILPFPLPLPLFLINYSWKTLIKSLHENLSQCIPGKLNLKRLVIGSILWLYANYILKQIK